MTALVYTRKYDNIDTYDYIFSPEYGEYYILSGGTRIILTLEERKELKPYWLQIGDSFQHQGTTYKVIDFGKYAEYITIHVSNNCGNPRQTFLVTKAFKLSVSLL